jgi:hypothetical protein
MICRLVRPTIIIALAILALAVGACGDDDETGASATDSTGTSTDTGTTTSTDETGLPQQRCQQAESPPNIVNVVSYGASCEGVEDAMSQLQSVSRQFRIGDFECTRTSGTRLSGTWECKGEAAYFTFDFGD